MVIYLLRLVVSGECGVASLAVAVLALDDVIILGLLHQYHLVDTALASSSDGPNVQGNLIVAARTLSSQPGWK